MCSLPFRPPCCSAPVAKRSRSRSMSAKGCQVCTSSAFPTSRAARRATASAPRCCRAASTGPTTCHDQPGAVAAAQDGSRARSADRRGGPRRREVMPADGRIEGLAFIGELGLDGSVRPIPGVVPIVAAIDNSRRRRRADAASEARSLQPRHGPSASPTLRELLATPARRRTVARPRRRRSRPSRRRRPDLCEVQGQPLARLALEIAAAGAHHRLFGPPGVGQDDARVPPARPPAAARAGAALEATMVHSAAGAPLPPSGLIERATVPSAAPHQFAGRHHRRRHGRHAARRGELSLTAGCCSSTRSLSFRLRSSTLCANRSRTGSSAAPFATPRRLPARFLLIAAMNPCPCGGGGARVPARAATRHSSATPDGSRVRCSIASICASTCTDRDRRDHGERPGESPRASWLPRARGAHAGTRTPGVPASPINHPTSIASHRSSPPAGRALAPRDGTRPTDRSRLSPCSPGRSDHRRSPRRPSRSREADAALALELRASLRPRGRKGVPHELPVLHSTRGIPRLARRLRRMTTARLASLLAHHDPVAAFHVAVGAGHHRPVLSAPPAKDDTLAETWRPRWPAP